MKKALGQMPQGFVVVSTGAKRRFRPTGVGDQ